MATITAVDRAGERRRKLVRARGLRSAAWLVALAAVVPALFALLRIDRPSLVDAEATAAVPGVPAPTV